MRGRIEAVNISQGGVPKAPVFEAPVSSGGVGGDTHTDLVRHGGADRAVTLFSLDVIHELQAEGHLVTAGSTGENLTVSSVDWTMVVPGAQLTIGGTVRLEVTGYTTPCAKLSAQFRNGDFMRMSQKKHPGSSRVCAKVLTDGIVRAGDSVDVG